MGIKQSSATVFIDFKKAYNSVRREGFYTILIEFGILMKVASLIKICLLNCIAESE